MTTMSRGMIGVAPNPLDSRRATQIFPMPAAKRIQIAQLFGQWPVRIVYGRRSDWRHEIDAVILGAGFGLQGPAGLCIMVLAPRDTPHVKAGEVLILGDASLVHIWHLGQDELPPEV